MNKKFWLAAFVAFIVFMLYSVIVEGILLASFLEEIWKDVARTEEIIWPFIVGAAVVALVMAFIYPKGYAGGQPWLEGLRFGLLFWLLLGVAEGLFVYGLLPIPGNKMVAAVLNDLVRLILAGIAVGAVYGKSKEETQAAS